MVGVGVWLMLVMFLRLVKLSAAAARSVFEASATADNDFCRGLFVVCKWMVLMIK